MRLNILVTFWIIQIYFCKAKGDSSVWRNIVTVDDFSLFINRPYVVLFFARNAGPQDHFTRRFDNHFADAKDYLADFGVEVGVVDCFSSPDHNVCSNSKEAVDKVFYYRNGRLLTDLPLDTMFNLDAIIANILHLVLLQEVPLLQSQLEFEKIMSRVSGKQDVIFGRMKAVGIPEDRAFIETAFAFNGKYQFVMTTVNDNFGIYSDWEEGSNSVWLIKSSRSRSGKSWPVIPFTNVITIEKLVVFLKGLEISNAVELTETSSVEFIHLNIPVVFLTGLTNHLSRLRRLMHSLASEFIGIAGFILINRDTATDHMKEMWKLERFMECSEMCAFLEAEGSLEVMEDQFTVDDIRQALKQTLDDKRSRDLEEMEEQEDDEDDDDEELYNTSQERQDDPVEAALFKLQVERQLNISATQQLTDKTFPQFIATHSVTMVMFTVKWNPICKAFLENYQNIGLAASDWTTTGFNPLARVECSDWPDVCDLKNVTSYPTLKVFKKSEDIQDYHGRLAESDILRAYFLHSTPSPVLLRSPQQLLSFYDGTYPDFSREQLQSVVIGIFPEENTIEKDIFEEISIEATGISLFGECIEGCVTEGLRMFGAEGPSVVTVKWEDPYQPFVTFDSAFTKNNLLRFISKSSRNILPELNPASLPSLLHDSPSIVMLFHQQETQSNLAKAELAKVALRSQFESLPITWIDASDEGNLGRRILKSYSLPIEGDVPQLLYLNRKRNSVCWYPHSPEFSESLLSDWLDSTLAGQEVTCAAALRHRDWTEMVKAYDFLAFIKEDEQAEKTLSGRIRTIKHPKDNTEDEMMEETEERVTDHMHTEL